MVLQDTQSIVNTVLNETIISACKNTLPYALEFSIEGQLQIVLDKSENIIFKINENHKKKPRTHSETRNNKKTPTASSRTARKSTTKPGTKRKRGRPRKIPQPVTDSETDNFEDSLNDTKDTSGETPEVKKELNDDLPVFPNLLSQMKTEDGAEDTLLDQEETAAQLQTLALQLAGDMSKALTNQNKETVDNEKEAPSTSEAVPLEEENKEEKNDLQTERASLEDHEDLELEETFSDTRPRTRRGKGLSREPYGCFLCAKQFTTQTLYNRHLKTHMNEKPYRCEVCDKRFGRLEHLRRHALNHTGHKPHKCGICKKSFVRLEHKKRHEMTHTDEKPHVCVYCGKGFKTSEAMLHHERKHEREARKEGDEKTESPKERRMATCRHCSKTFMRKYIKIHERTHTGEKPYQCSFCGKSFNLSAAMRMHERLHTGDLPYPCRYCDKSFCDKKTQTRHEKIHFREKSHKCMFCDKGFTRPDNLKTHIRCHTEERPYKCDQCEMTFRQPRSLKDHKSSVHSNKTGEEPIGHGQYIAHNVGPASNEMPAPRTQPVLAHINEVPNVQTLAGVRPEHRAAPNIETPNLPTVYREYILHPYPNIW